MAFLYEKSATWRWIVRSCRDSKQFFYTFATICGVIPGVVGYGVMQFTNNNSEKIQADLRKNASEDSLMMGKVNKERLAEFLGELQRKENTEDRYVAALRGETLTRNPYVRIQPVPKQKPKNSEVKTEIDGQTKSVS